MPQMKRIPGASIRDQAYDQLRTAILDGTFSMGFRLDLAELSANLGVSKTPLTEAVQKLIREGLVTVKPRSGTFVSELGRKQVCESFGFRRAIEIGAAGMIIRNITDADITRLTGMNEKMRHLFFDDGKEAALNDFLHLDVDFHDTLVGASGNELIRDHYRQVDTLLMVMRIRNLYPRHNYGGALLEHDQIVDALKTRDREAFVAASRQHLDSGEEKMLKLTEAIESERAAAGK
ncbi:MAG: GntR family transcriptional regulator [Rhodospirillales bacterium]|nr:GntR family transcriptional regulator [Rhodospirillales bacterium]